jgi:hypothetical protein
VRSKPRRKVYTARRLYHKGAVDRLSVFYDYDTG